MCALASSPRETSEAGAALFENSVFAYDVFEQAGGHAAFGHQ